MDYAYINSIILKIFGKKIFYSNNLISLEPKELYAFVINNFDLITIQKNVTKNHFFCFVNTTNYAKISTR